MEIEPKTKLKLAGENYSAVLYVWIVVIPLMYCSFHYKLSWLQIVKNL